MVLPLGGQIASDYVDSWGNKIWDSKKNAPYHFQIAGIGRDDGSDLLQGNSTTSVFPSVVSIGTYDPSQAFNDRDFLLWGDNQQPLDWEKMTNGVVQMLQRCWRIQISNQAGDIPTQFQLFPEHLFGALEREENYWLVVDYSAKGQFYAKDVSFFPIRATNQKWIADSVRWAKTSHGIANFRIAKGPSFFPYVSTLKPNCSSDASGQITLKMIGGEPPFDIELQPEKGALQRFTIKNPDSAVVFDQLRPGSYTLMARDERGQTFRKTIYLETIDGPAVPLQSNFYLPKNGLMIDLSEIKKGGLTTYRWTGPEGFTSAEEKVRIDAPGHYTIAIEQDNCFSFKSFQVLEAEASLIKQIALLPNPVISQRPFQVKVSLFESQKVSLNIIDVLGNQVQSLVKKGQTHYQFEAKVDTPGTYLIKIQAANHSRTIRLIVQS